MRRAARPRVAISDLARKRQNSRRGAAHSKQAARAAACSVSLNLDELLAKVPAAVVALEVSAGRADEAVALGVGAGVPGTIIP